MNRESCWKQIPFLLLPILPWKKNTDNTVTSMLGTPPSATPIRLCGVTGYDGRINDIVYCHPSARSEQHMAVVFFGGDIQDFAANMESHRDNKHYSKWNLENTCLLLHKYFPESHIVVVRPSRLTAPKLASFMEFVSSEMDQNRMEFKTFSCYDNFVPCNNCGAPDHTPTHYALQHLERLLQGISLRLRSMPPSELLHSSSHSSEEATERNVPVSHEEEAPSLWWREQLNLDKAHLVLIGFSKGCVVLNQFIYEFHYLKTLTPDDDTMMRLVSRIQDMYWLDGGHAGGKNTWITSRSLLETLTRLGIGIHIHVTPYQVHDERRPWIRKEEKSFGDLLRRLGAPVQRTIHFENQVASLLTHFEVLDSFRQMPRKCCVPGCKSNYDTTVQSQGSVSIFSFPKEETKRLAWIRAIPRKDWCPTSPSVECANHFDEKDIIINASWKHENDSVTKLALRCPKLKENAVT